MPLLEIEGQYHHAARCSVERLSVLEQVLVYEVATVLYQQISESEAELQLRDELEEGQIQVTSKANLKHCIEALCEQCLLLLYGKVYHRCQACYYVGSVVVESLRCILYVNGA